MHRYSILLHTQYITTHPIYYIMKYAYTYHSQIISLIYITILIFTFASLQTIHVHAHARSSSVTGILHRLFRHGIITASSPAASSTADTTTTQHHQHHADINAMDSHTVYDAYMNNTASSSLSSSSSYIDSCHRHQHKVLVIALDGTRGDIFHDLLINGELPNFRRLLLKHHGKSSTCKDVYDTNCAHTHTGMRLQTSFSTASVTPVQRYTVMSPYEWMTAPGWLSVLTGVNNDKHKVYGNDRDSELRYYNEIRHKYPTLLKIAKENGYVTAAVVCVYSTSHMTRHQYDDRQFTWQEFAV
jgi:hypothetical protein